MVELKQIMNTKTIQFVDSALAEKGRMPAFLGLGERTENEPVLFHRGRKVRNFFTEDSKLYITPQESKLLRDGTQLDRRAKKWDSLAARVVKNYQRYQPHRQTILARKFQRSYAKIKDNFQNVAEQPLGFLPQLSLPKLWNFSIVAAILFGMFLMTMIYRYLGPGAAAVSRDEILSEAGVEMEQSQLPAELKSNAELDKEIGDKITQQFMESLGQKEKKDLEQEIATLVAGYPIEKMLSYILEKDKTVVAFLIGIAKKESNWGKRIPVLDGQDCFNYWGYRGQRKMMGSGGHTCFNSREDAVDTVAKRIEWLVKNEKLETPAEMIVWKCGATCAGHSRYDVKKWISDVNMYFEKLND